MSSPSELPALDDLENFVDPRVQVELERLNNATDAINKLEVELDEARSAFRQLLSEASQQINVLARKLGTCVEKARPYYEARMRAKEAQQETQKAALRFERANSAHAAAKEMVYLAEEGLQKEGRTFDPAWQEMLNHATIRVNEAERERTLSEQEHRRKSRIYNQTEQEVQVLQQELKKAITKSSMNARRSLLQLNNMAYQYQLLLLPYFEMKAQFNQMMEEQKRRVESLEKTVVNAKQSYADALQNLETISDEIHQHRVRREAVTRSLGHRGVGVGAESPSLESATGSSHSGASGRLRKFPSELDDLMEADDTYMRLPSRLGSGITKSYSSSTISSLLGSGYRLLDSPTASHVPTTTSKAHFRKSVSVQGQEEWPLSHSQLGNSISEDSHMKTVNRLSLQEVAPSRSSSDGSSLVDRDKEHRTSVNEMMHLTNNKVEQWVLNQGQNFGSGESLSPQSPLLPKTMDETDPLISAVAVETSLRPNSRKATKGPVSRFHSLAGERENTPDVSDSESLASVDVLSDDQIANLMLDKELEFAAQSMNFLPGGDTNTLVSLTARSASQLIQNSNSPHLIRQLYGPCKLVSLHPHSTEARNHNGTHWLLPSSEVAGLEPSFSLLKVSSVAADHQERY